MCATAPRSLVLLRVESIPFHPSLTAEDLKSREAIGYSFLHFNEMAFHRGRQPCIEPTAPRISFELR